MHASRTLGILSGLVAAIAALAGAPPGQAAAASATLVGAAPSQAAAASATLAGAAPGQAAAASATLAGAAPGQAAAASATLAGTAPTQAAAASATLAGAAPTQAAAASASFAGAAPGQGAAASGAAAADRCVARTVALSVQGSILCVLIDDPARALRQRLLFDWIERSARIVAAYYARFPAPLVELRIQVAPGRGVRGGRTTNDSGLVIQVSVGREVTSDELAADWVLVHEMVHLALPELGRRHNWLAEGLAVYVEGIARAQFGNRDITDVWAEYRHSMPLGLPRAGEGGMDQTPTWARTYWGGALYCLQADVAIREQTGNRIGLQTALRAILKETGGYRAERDIDDVLRIGDAATGTRVMQDLYRQIKSTALTPDLDLLWVRLGIPIDPKSQPFDDHAPLAAIRIAITARYPEHP